MKLKTAIKLGRVSNLPTVWSNVGAAVALSGAGAESTTDLLCSIGALSAAFSLMYTGGMFLNDAFDQEFDQEHRTERPIPQGEASSREVFVSGFGLLALGVLAMAAYSLQKFGTLHSLPILAALLLCATIVAYNAKHKGNPFSPLLMGLCRVQVFTTASLAVAHEVNQSVWLTCATLLSYLIGLTYIAKQETLTRVKNLWPLALLSVPVLVTLPQVGQSALSLLTGLGLALWIIWSVSRLMPRRGPPQIGRCVVSLIAGISLHDASAVSQLGNAPAVALCVAAFAMTLFAQRWVPGS